ncbi:MAG: hypothetical protein KCHDKBKB_02288 [Elusimicrobia bacterium]|nr:hypothetical protein [Elusimicrobiota bacterium]
MRHAEAVPALEWRKSDADRPLSKKGISELEKGLGEMKRVGFSVPLVLSSPYKRAQDTALLLTRFLALPDPVFLPDLSSGVNYKTLMKVALDYIQKSSLLLVGHMPEIAIFGCRISGEPAVMDKGLEPADVLAIRPAIVNNDWEDGEILWWRKLSDWKGLS